MALIVLKDQFHGNATRYAQLLCFWTSDEHKLKHNKHNIIIVDDTNDGEKERKL